jgi:hypothetical protein
MMKRATTQQQRQDRDASWGNARLQRGAFIRERVAQTGCLAIEAAREWARQNPGAARLLRMGVL